MDAPEPSDAELVVRVKAGARDDYAVLVRRHHAAVSGLCRSMLGDAALAEDAAQEAFLKAYRSLGDFRGDAAFATWLTRIAANRCLDLLRARARRAEESLDALAEADWGRLERLLARGAAPSDPLEDADLVERVLARLPPDYRLVLTLREVRGLSYEETAAVMACTLDSVRARLRRAREALAEAARHFSGPGGV